MRFDGVGLAAAATRRLRSRSRVRGRPPGLPRGGVRRRRRRLVVRERPADSMSLTAAVSRRSTVSYGLGDVGYGQGKGSDATDQRRSCRPSFPVAFEHRLTHRAQGEACVPLQPVQMSFEARDRRQVHRAPRVPVQRRREARQPAGRPLRRLNRGVAADA